MPISEKLIDYVNEMESYIDSHDIRKLSVSKASVGWHIDHNLKVINNVIKTLQTSDPKTYKDNFKFLGKVFLGIGYFPRGKAKAPKYVRPPEVILKDDLITQSELAKSAINTIEGLDKNAYFKHPLFGNVNKKRVHGFLETHTNHHLKIIRSILKK